MCGPTGIGVLYGKAQTSDAMPPFLGGGDMIKEVKLRSFRPNDVPHKFEAGTPAIAEAVGLGAAVQYLLVTWHVLYLSPRTRHHGVRPGALGGGAGPPAVRDRWQTSAAVSYRSHLTASIRTMLRRSWIVMGWQSAPGTIALSRFMSASEFQQAPGPASTCTLPGRKWMPSSAACTR